MSAILISCVFIAGLVMGVIKGWDIGEDHGRKKERRQVLAFLHAEYRDEDARVQDARERINNGEHLKWNIVKKPPRMRGA